MYITIILKYFQRSKFYKKESSCGINASIYFNNKDEKKNLKHFKSDIESNIILFDTTKYFSLDISYLYLF